MSPILVVLGLIVIILAFIVITYYFWANPDSRKNLTDYFTVLAGFGILILFIGLVYDIYDSQVQHSKDLRDQLLDLRRRLYDKVSSLFIGNPDLTTLYNQLYGQDRSQHKATYAERLAMAELFGFMDEVVSLNHQWRTELVPWDQLFLTWLGSPLMQSYWQDNHQFYSASLNRFIEAIFSNKLMMAWSIGGTSAMANNRLVSSWLFDLPALRILAWSSRLKLVYWNVGSI